MSALYPTKPFLRWIQIIFLTASTFILFLGFFRNQWNAARFQKFSNSDKFSEGLVIGRLVQSRQYGIFSQSALIGMGDTDPNSVKEIDTDYQLNAYLTGGTFSTYFPYRSQNAVQAIVFSLLDSVSPFAPTINLRLFRGINSLLSALMIGLLLTWIYREFGLLPALIALITTVRSQWLTVFGRNIFWGIWLYFMPFLAVTFWLQREKQNKTINNIGLLAVVFAAILLKCLFSGYDFISTAAISACIPILYFAIVDRWDLSRLVQKGITAIAGGTLAIMLSLAILAGQVGALDGGYGKGLLHIVNSVSRRTYGVPEQFPGYEVSLQAKATDVLFQYLTGDEIFRRQPVRFLDVTLLFVFCSVIFVLFDLWKKRLIGQRWKAYALIAATWLAFVSSISTYVIFKGASHIHTFLYFIVWHLPFTILGFAMCGFVLQVILQTLLLRTTEQHEDLKLA
jgi:hypothetical protein